MSSTALLSGTSPARDSRAAAPSRSCIGGAGYLRELHEENAFVEEGVEYHAGGGIKWWFGQSGRIGIRAEGGHLDT